MMPIISSISAMIVLVLPGRDMAEGSAGENVVAVIRIVILAGGDSGSERHSGDMDENRLTTMVNARLGRRSGDQPRGRLFAARLRFARQNYPAAPRQREHRLAQPAGRVAVEIGEHDDGELAIGIIAQPDIEPVDSAAVRDGGAAVGRDDGDAQRIVVLERRQIRLERVRLEQLAAEQAALPFKQVVGRRIECTRTLGNRHGDIVGVDHALGRGAVARRAARNDRRVAVIAGVGHAERLEDGVGKERGIGLAARRFDDRGEQDVARVGIGVFLARLEIERLVAEALDQARGGRLERLQLRIVGEGGEIGNAAGVGEEVVDRHLVPGCRRIGQIGLDRRVELHLAAFLEQQDRGGGELLGHRAEAELGVAVIGDLPFEIRRAIAL
eukprot:Opistho-1_new@63683